MLFLRFLWIKSRYFVIVTMIWVLLTQFSYLAMLYLNIGDELLRVFISVFMIPLVFLLLLSLMAKIYCNYQEYKKDLKDKKIILEVQQQIMYNITQDPHHPEFRNLENIGLMAKPYMLDFSGNAKSVYIITPIGERICCNLNEFLEPILIHDMEVKKNAIPRTTCTKTEDQ